MAGSVDPMQPVDIMRSPISARWQAPDDGAELPFEWPQADDSPALDSTLTGWSRLDGKSRLIIRRDGHLIACSDDVPELIRHHECFRLDKGRIRIIDEAARKTFAQLVERPMATAATLLLRRPECGGHWIVRLVGGDDETLFITLQRAAVDQMAELPDLREAFGFTPCEARIVSDLHSGLTPQAIAESQGISIHTVRAHVRRCYDKLQITSREELWQRLSAYQI